MSHLFTGVNHNFTHFNETQMGEIISLNIFNVKVYGAEGNDRTDDTSSIQDAINASTAGSVIYFPSTVSNIYQVSTIKLIGNRSYVGPSYANVMIKQKDSANSEAVLIADAYKDNHSTVGTPILMKNLVIDGNKANNTGTIGILLMNWSSIIRNVEVYRCPGVGIKFVDKNSAGTLISNTAAENRIEGCRVSDCDGIGIHIADTGNKISDGFMIGNLVTGGTTGIEIDRGSGWLVDGNHVYSVDENGILVSYCYGTRIVNNYVSEYGLSTSADYYQGIKAHLSSGDVTVVANNNIWCSEDNASSTYYHLQVNGAGSVATYATCLGNAVYGGNTAAGTGLVYSTGAAGTLDIASSLNLAINCNAEKIIGGTVTVVTGS